MSIWSCSTHLGGTEFVQMPAEQVRNRLRVTEHPEDRLYSRSADRGKKVLQIHPQNNAFA